MVHVGSMWDRLVIRFNTCVTRGMPSSHYCSISYPFRYDVAQLLVSSRIGDQVNVGCCKENLEVQVLWYNRLWSSLLVVLIYCSVNTSLTWFWHSTHKDYSAEIRKGGICHPNLNAGVATTDVQRRWNEYLESLQRLCLLLLWRLLCSYFHQIVWRMGTCWTATLVASPNPGWLPPLVSFIDG